MDVEREFRLYSIMDQYGVDIDTAGLMLLDGEEEEANERKD